MRSSSRTSGPASDTHSRAVGDPAGASVHSIDPILLIAVQPALRRYRGEAREASRGGETGDARPVDRMILQVRPEGKDGEAFA